MKREPVTRLHHRLPKFFTPARRSDEFADLEFEQVGLVHT